VVVGEEDVVGSAAWLDSRKPKLTPKTRPRYPRPGTDVSFDSGMTRALLTALGTFNTVRPKQNRGLPRTLFAPQLGLLRLPCCSWVVHPRPPDCNQTW